MNHFFLFLSQIDFVIEKSDKGSGWLAFHISDKSKRFFYHVSHVIWLLRHKPSFLLEYQEKAACSECSITLFSKNV